MEAPIRTAPNERWLSVREAHEKTGFSVTTIYNAINAGKLRALRHGSRTFRILPADLDRWAEGMVYKPNRK